MTSREFILNAIRSHKPELAKFGIHTIGLFGSYVRGEASEDSDIDILIEFSPENESFDNLMAAYDFFEELFKDEKVELVTKKSLSPYIGPAVLNEVVYA
jgi:predicted nucleotidyltransferase